MQPQLFFLAILVPAVIAIAIPQPGDAISQPRDNEDESEEEMYVPLLGVPK